MIIRGTKEESKALRWLDKAKAGEDRPILDTWHRRNGVLLCCDGFRLHALPTPDCLKDIPDTNQHGQANLAGKIPAGDFVADLETKANLYPNMAQIMPVPAEIILEFAINPKYLREALAGFSGENMVIIRKYARPESENSDWLMSPITIHGVERYALVADMHAHNPKVWEPDFSEEAKE